MLKEEIADRVRRIAKSTDGLIARLDTISGRIDIAAKNDNRELVDYYERQFAEVSAEFMGGIETMIDDWYQLKGEKRPVSTDEYLSPEMLDEIHRTMVSIVHGASPESVIQPRNAAAGLDLTTGAGVDIAINGEDIKPATHKKVASAGKQENRVDLTG